MKQIYQSLMLAAAMLGIAALGAYGFVPRDVAQFAPFLLLALFPGAWLGSERACNPVKRGAA